MLDVNGVLEKLLALVVPAGSQDVIVGKELAYFFCQPGRGTLVYF